MRIKRNLIQIGLPGAAVCLNSLRRAAPVMTRIYTLALCGLMLPSLAVAEGTWVKVLQKVPGGLGTMLLLSDGTVMAQGGANQATNTWYRLTPDSTGGYANGTWTTRTSMNYSRLFYTSVVLQDGRVFFAGAEYGTGTTNAEVYNPFYSPNPDSWAIIPVPFGLIQTDNTNFANGENSKGFSDCGGVILSNGIVLVAPVHPYYYGSTVLFNPISNTLSLGPAIKHGYFLDEASLLKLPDDSILVVDSFTNTSERYIPSLNQWVADANVPVNLYDPYGGEMGAGFLLPNGNAFFLGSTPNTAIYTPSGTTAAGIWTTGPTIPNSLGAPDAPAAMMVNGKILCAFAQTPYGTNSSTIFIPPIYFYEFDYNNQSASPNGTFTQVHAPNGSLFDTDGPGGDGPGGGFTFTCRMLDLPDGTVLFTDSNTNGQLYVYIPDASPLAAGKPKIKGITTNPDGSFTLSGTGLNGISQGAAYGDDAQMDSNYPLVRFTDGSGNVLYGTTYNWSSTSVMTGTNIVSTQFALPLNLPAGSYLTVVANGIASDAVAFYPSDTPTVNLVFPTDGAVLSDSSAPQILGYADDTNATLYVVRVALARNSDGAWYDFVSSGWGTTTFDFNRNVLNASDVLVSRNTGWLAQLPSLPAGNYTVRVQSVNLFNNASLWKSVAFTIESPPVVTFSPLTDLQVVFNFDQLGGTVNETSTVQFKIEWFKSGGNQFWNGVNWTSVASDPGVLLPANLSGLNWTPAPGTLPPRLQLAQASYVIHVFATDAAGDVGSNALVLTRSPLDTTPPLVTLDNILNGAVLTNQYLPGLSGSALDFDSGITLVQVHLYRFSGGSPLYWNGSSWGSTPVVLPVTYNSINVAWQVNAPLPAGANLPNGGYGVEVYVVNGESPALNTDLIVSFSVDYHPVFVFTAGSYNDVNPANHNMNWSDPANWDVGSVPTSDARVVITNYSPNNTSLGSLQLYRLDLSGGSLTTSGMLITNLNVSGGVLSGGAIGLPANGVFNWSGGTLTGFFNVPAGATVNLTGSADKTLTTATLVNNGTVTWNGGNLLASYGSVITNNSTFVIQSSGFLYNNNGYYGYGPPPPLFVNNGLLQKTISNGQTVIAPDNAGWTFSQNGTIDVENGALSAQSQFNVNSGAIFAGPGETRVDAGTILINGTNTIQAGATVELAGGNWNGNNVFTGPGTFVWSGGTIGAQLNLQSNIALNITGAADKLLYLGSLTSAGPVTWAGAGHVECSFGSAFTNNATFTIQTDSFFDCDGTYYGYGPPPPLFVNNGSVIKNTTTGTTFFHAGQYGSVAFNNNGSVNVQSGSLALGGGGIAANDSFTVAAGSVIDFTNGTFYFNGNQSLLGAGTERVSGGTLTFNNGTNTLGGGNTFAIAAGSLSGTAAFAGAGSFVWSGGTIGSQLNLQSNIALNITGAADKLLYLGSLTSAGPVTWAGAGHVECSFGSAFTNNATFTIQTDSFFDCDGTYYGYGPPPPLFVNNGSVIKNTTTGTTFFHAGGYGGVAFNNNGTVDLRTGSLAINSSYTLSGSPQLKLVLGGLNPGTQFSQETFGGAATLGGVLNVTLANGFMPTNGQSFALATYGSSTGQFATTQFPPLPLVSRWQLAYNANSLVLQVLPTAVFQNPSTINGKFQFTFVGQTGSSCIIYGSTNSTHLFVWVPLLTNTPFNGTLDFVDPQSAQFPGRLYHATIFP
jgi:hypothetical protein